jgi:hypothetical protein
VADLQEGKRNMLDTKDSMVPSRYTNLKVIDMSSHDLYALNTISNVNIDSAKQAGFSINDICLELSHFLDDDTLDRVELDLHSAQLQNNWGLPKDFKLVETRNKEISMVVNQIEELAWRIAGAFSDEERSSIKEMFSVGRNKDSFDKFYYENDIKSLD